MPVLKKSVLSNSNNITALSVELDKYAALPII